MTHEQMQAELDDLQAGAQALLNHTRAMIRRMERNEQNVLAYIQRLHAISAALHQAREADAADWWKQGGDHGAG